MIDVTLIDSMGSDLTVVNSARVSFNKTSEWDSDNELKVSDKILIKYLARNKHMSPFGHCFATFHVKAPIFVARQLVKHKFLRWNEVSRRYVDDEPELYEPNEWRGRSVDKKQGSEGTTYPDQDIISFYKHTALLSYNQLLDQGVAPEQARMVLPQSTMTEWYWSGSLDAWFDMCQLRRKEDAQYESRLVANSVSMDMSTLYPESWKSLMENSR
tara:strand:- start:12741 stop:13382 length:642 start_codon:yes stop_codon:yes gene_type:complete